MKKIIFDLRSNKLGERKYIKQLESENFNFNEGIKKLIEEVETTLQILQKTNELTQRESLYDSCVSLPGRLGQSDQPIQIKSEFCTRSKSCTLFSFSEQQPAEVTEASNSAFKLK